MMWLGSNGHLIVFGCEFIIIINSIAFMSIYLWKDGQGKRKSSQRLKKDENGAFSVVILAILTFSWDIVSKVHF